MADHDRRVSVLIVEEREDERARITAEAAATPEIDVYFAGSGQQALAHIEFHGGIDVLATAASESRSEGLHLLTEARLTQPALGRVLVADDGQIDGAGASLASAHEVVRGPLSPVSLLSFALRYRDFAQADPQTLALVGSVETLPSPPAHVAMLNEAIASPEIGMDTVAGSLETDVAVSAKLLSLVNSAYFGLPHRVSSVRHALTYLGLETTRNLVGAMELVNTIGKVAPELRPHVQLINTHSMKVATRARRLAEGTHYTHDAFAAGLLHDIGMLLLLNVEPAKFRAVCEMPEAETDIIGVSHAQLGAALLHTWGLPWQIVDAVAQSHDADSMIDPVASATHAVFVAEHVGTFADGQPMPWETARMPSSNYLESVRARESVLELVNQRAVR